jgi:hypothetical protein
MAHLITKKSLISQYSKRGFADPMLVAKNAGILELGMALLILVKPRQLLILVLFWKIGTEIFIRRMNS